MNGTKATGKTIGEVERLTGIPKRELKYYIEQKLMRPSQRSEIGYWLYSGEDVRRAQLIWLCRELDFPIRVIQAILAEPDTRWPQELERQIIRLTDMQNQLESRLHTAKHLLHSGVWEAVQIYYDAQAEKTPY